LWFFFGVILAVIAVPALLLRNSDDLKRRRQNAEKSFLDV